MKAGQSLWQLTVVGTAESADSVVRLLEECVGGTPWIVEDFERQTVSIHALLKQPPAPRDPAMRLLRAGLNLLGLPTASGQSAPWRVQALRKRDWAESWKRHFPATIIGGRLLLKPPWSHRQARTGQSVLIINPGLSFGTGHHATTRFCLQQVVEASRLIRPGAMLDVGCGSGILAIAAAKLGFSPVDAFDLDPTAVRVTAANARRNRVAAGIRVREKNVFHLPLRANLRFELVCANLTNDLLLAGRDRILAALAEGGWLVLAGILASQFAEVRSAYESRGCRLEADATEGEWRSGRFTCSRRASRPAASRRLSNVDS